MATLLIGYDVEACAIGEGLACLGAHGLGEAIDRATTGRALEVIRRNHEDHGVPGTLFVCGRTLVHNVEALEAFVDHPLFDIQQHTYSHTLLKDDHWQGGTFLASPVVAIEQEVRQTSEALRRLLGVECIGLRTPHGYHLGLTDRPEMLAALHRCGIRFVSSWARNAEGVNPTPLSVQPFWYGDQGFDDILEIPFQGWLDGTWFEEYGIDRADDYAAVLRATIDEIVADDLVYGACFHDWAQIRYREAETGWVAGLMAYAHDQGVATASYAAFHADRLSARREQLVVHRAMKPSHTTTIPRGGPMTRTKHHGFARPLIATAAAFAGTVALGAAAQATTAPDGDKGVIAFSYGNESAGIYPIVAGPARIQAEARGYQFLEGSANGDCEQQVSDIENFVVQQVDAIVVLPLCGVDPLAPVLADATAAGIKVVGYSTEIPGGDGAIVYQNKQGAQAVADEALRWLDENYTGDPENFTWALYTYDQCGAPCTDRTDTIRDAIVAATGVEPLEAEAVDETTGLNAAETFLQQEPDLAMLIGINDAGALGAYQAFQGAIANGRDPESIFVGGMDGQTEALELIADGGGEGGIYRASGALILDDLGRAVADLPADLIEGKDVSVLELPYELVTPADTARAQEIVDTYNSFTADVSADTSAAGTAVEATAAAGSEG